MSSAGVHSALLHRTTLDIYNQPDQYRKTNIICTIGPKTNNVEVLAELMKSGMNIVRMNFSHGSHAYHKSVIDNSRAAVATLKDTVVAIALDTKGPEIRTGTLVDDKDVFLEKGHEVIVSVDEQYSECGTAERIFVDYKNLPKVMEVGKFIFIDDGLISIQVEEIGEDYVKAKVINSGNLGSHKGVNLPDVHVDLPALSEKDKKDLAFGVENNVDMIFASFIRRPEDVLEVRECLGEKGKHIKIISKIENHQGVRNFDEILKVTDGVMVARGDLGIEIPAQKVFLAQKMMISKCNIAGKPVICATQMLESMTFNPRPTRAEVSDVANAVLDGSDCVMLSGETAKGSYPLEAVRMMAEICREAESVIFYQPLFIELRVASHSQSGPLSMSETVASSCVNAAFDNGASGIICLTISGNSARLISKYRPACPIFVVTRNAHTARCSHLSRSCYPIYYAEDRAPGEWQEDVDNRINYACEFGKRKGLLKSGQTVVAIQGWKGGAGNTNTIRILIVP